MGRSNWSSNQVTRRLKSARAAARERTILSQAGAVVEDPDRGDGRRCLVLLAQPLLISNIVVSGTFAAL